MAIKPLPCPNCESESLQFLTGTALTLRCTTCLLSLQAPLGYEEYLVSVWNSMPRNLGLTSNPPTKPGFYFKYYPFNSEKPLIVEYIDQWTINLGISKKDMIFWAGPIKEPKLNI